MRSFLFLAGIAALSACSKPNTVEEEVQQAARVASWMFDGQEIEGGGRIEAVQAKGRTIVWTFADLPNDSSTDHDAWEEFHRELICQRDRDSLFKKGVTMRFEGKMEDQTPLPSVTIDHC